MYDNNMNCSLHRICKVFLVTWLMLVTVWHIFIHPPYIPLQDVVSVAYVLNVMFVSVTYMVIT